MCHRHHLRAVRTDHRGVDGLLGIPRHVLHAGTVRGHHQAEKARREEEPLLRVVRQDLQLDRQDLSRPYRQGGQLRAALDDCVRAGGGADRLSVHQAADQLRARRGSGLRAGAGQSAVRLDPAADRPRDGRNARQDHQWRSRQKHRRHFPAGRLQLRRVPTRTSAWRSSSWPTGTSASTRRCS